MQIHPIYHQFFPENGVSPTDWTPFQNYQAHRETPLPPDFSILPKTGWKECVKKILLILLKTLLFPWGLYEIAKYLIDRFAMRHILPAQSGFSQKALEEQRQTIAAMLIHKQLSYCVGREVILEKNGMRYQGFLFGYKGSLNNGKWALFAPGNMATIEKEFFQLKGPTIPLLEAGFNLLFVNAPGVAMSGGPATVERLGDAQEVALSFLESAVKAKQIAYIGHSLGGAAIGLATLQHEFKKDVHYLAMRLMTFDRLSHIAAAFCGKLAGAALRCLGLEMDSVAASKKMQEEGIPEVIVQAAQDETLVKEAPLLDTLQKEHLMDNKTGFIVDTDHCTMPAELMTEQIKKWDRSLNPIEQTG